MILGRGVHVLYRCDPKVEKETSKSSFQERPPEKLVKAAAHRLTRPQTATGTRKSAHSTPKRPQSAQSAHSFERNLAKGSPKDHILPLKGRARPSSRGSQGANGSGAEDLAYSSGSETSPSRRNPSIFWPRNRPFSPPATRPFSATTASTFADHLRDAPPQLDARLPPWQSPGPRVPKAEFGVAMDPAHQKAAWTIQHAQHASLVAGIRPKSPHSAVSPGTPAPRARVVSPGGNKRGSGVLTGSPVLHGGSVRSRIIASPNVPASVWMVEPEKGTKQGDGKEKIKKRSDGEEKNKTQSDDGEKSKKHTGRVEWEGKKGDGGKTAAKYRHQDESVAESTSKRVQPPKLVVPERKETEEPSDGPVRGSSTSKNEVSSGSARKSARMSARTSARDEGRKQNEEKTHHKEEVTLDEERQRDGGVKQELMASAFAAAAAVVSGEGSYDDADVESELNSPSRLTIGLSPYTNKDGVPNLGLCGSSRRSSLARTPRRPKSDFEAESLGDVPSQLSYYLHSDGGGSFVDLLELEETPLQRRLRKQREKKRPTTAPPHAFRIQTYDSKVDKYHGRIRSPSPPPHRGLRLDDFEFDESDAMEYISPRNPATPGENDHSIRSRGRGGREQSGRGSVRPASATVRSPMRSPPSQRPSSAAPHPVRRRPVSASTHTAYHRMQHHLHTVSEALARPNSALGISMGLSSRSGATTAAVTDRVGEKRREEITKYLFVTGGPPSAHSIQGTNNRLAVAARNRALSDARNRGCAHPRCAARDFLHKHEKDALMEYDPVGMPSYDSPPHTRPTTPGATHSRHVSTPHGNGRNAAHSRHVRSAPGSYPYEDTKSGTLWTSIACGATPTAATAAASHGAGRGGMVATGANVSGEAVTRQGGYEETDDGHEDGSARLIKRRPSINAGAVAAEVSQYSTMTGMTCMTSSTSRKPKGPCPTAVSVGNALALRKNMRKPHRTRSAGFVACGRAHAILILDGNVFSCGHSPHASAALGHGPRSVFLPIPVRVAGLHKIKIHHAAAGFTHSVFVNAQGAVFSCGVNEYGQLGHGDTRTVHVPKAVEAVAGERILRVACGAYHTVLVSEEHRVYTCGSGLQGQLGHGDFKNQVLPTVVQKALMLPIQNTFAGFYHTLLLSTSGQVYGFGHNEHFQLGLGPSRRDEPFPVHVEALDQVSVVSACAGESHSVFVTQDGMVLGVGDNSYGQLGTSLDIPEFQWPLVIEQLCTLNVVSVSCGSDHTLALCEDGAVYSFGQNRRGCLGLGDDADRCLPSPVPISSFGGDFVSSVSGGGDFDDPFSFVCSENSVFFSFGSSLRGRTGTYDEEKIAESERGRKARKPSMSDYLGIKRHEDPFLTPVPQTVYLYISFPEDLIAMLTSLEARLNSTSRGGSGSLSDGEGGGRVPRGNDNESETEGGSGKKEKKEKPSAVSLLADLQDVDYSADPESRYNYWIKQEIANQLSRDW
eukprot:Rmarinus@m.2880